MRTLGPTQDRVLRMLQSADGITGPEINRRLGKSKQLVDVTIYRLRERGYDIRWHPDRGFRLMREEPA